MPIRPRKKSNRRGSKTRQAVSAGALPSIKKNFSPATLPPYVANEKTRFSFLIGEDFPEKRNIAWRTEPAVEDPANPLLEPKYPWDAGSVFSHGTVMRDPIDKLWKAWYLSTPEDQLPPASPCFGRILTYAESEDGIRWTRPELDIAPYQGRTRSNILLNLDSGGPAQHASVIVHPDAPDDWRYEMFVLRYPGYDNSPKLVRGFPFAPGETEHTEGMYRYRSADGKHWKPWEKVYLETSDSLWITQLADGDYQAYHKTAIPTLPGGLVPYDIAAGYCRVMARRTSPNGTAWSPLEIVISPDWMDSADTQFMELIALAENDGYVGLLTVYHVLTQTIDIQFAASRDGKNWWRPDRRACLPLKPLGEYGGGMIWPLQPAILDSGRLHLYYAACDGLHGDYLSTEAIEQVRRTGLHDWPYHWQNLYLGKDVYCPITNFTWFHSVLCRSSWREGRLWAAVTAAGGNSEGVMGTKVLPVGGKRLHVNAATSQNGSVEVELLEGEKTIPGFGRSECLPFRGDESSTLIRWKGGDRCPTEKARSRLYLRGARLYSCDWVK